LLLALGLAIHRRLNSLTFLTGFCPRDGQSCHLATLPGGANVLQRTDDDATLQIAMKRDAKMVPHHKWQEHCARWFDLVRHIQSDRDGNCGDVPAFYGALNQRDGLVSYRSGRTE
jgi:hypothetical protein